MSIQKFPLETVKKIRQIIQNALSLEDMERQSQTWAGLDDVEDLPEPKSLDDLSGVFTFGGISAEDASVPSLRDSWFISTVNPGAALLKLPGLKLKSDVRLVSYLYRNGQDGLGLVMAVPETLSTTAQLEKALQTANGLTHPPKPHGALSSLMDAFEGDRSPISFVIASMLRRELQEFGAVGKRRNWCHHRLIDAIPPQAKCVWRVEQPPKDLSVKVKVSPDGQAAIEFFSFRAGDPIHIFRHLDQYAAGQYRSNSLDKPIASVIR